MVEVAPSRRIRSTDSIAVVYFSHFLGYWHGWKPWTLNADPNVPQSMGGWEATDIELVVQEGRIQIDRQHKDLEQIRTRAQFMITTGLLLVAALIAAQSRVAGHLVPSLAWWTGVILAVVGVLGFGAVVVSQMSMGTISTAKFTHPPDVNASFDLATGYARIVKQGEDTLATELTTFRMDVLMFLAGILLAGCGVLLGP